jgi:uncharacterized protein YgiM (DUF1202 family)
MSWVLALAALSLSQEGESPKAIRINTKTALVKQGPSFSTKLIQTAKHGDEFVVLGREGVWFKVQLDGDAVGYIHKSATIEKSKYKPPMGEEGTGDKGLAMGAKGWNPEVEKAYIQKNNMGEAFKLLDESVIGLPAYKHDRAALDARLERFRREGNLK